MQYPGGAEVELSMLFVDARGSTVLAEQMTAKEFSRLMDRFYKPATRVLIKTDAFIDKLDSGAEGTVMDVTALGDNMNTAARLASSAGPGEAIISEAAYAAAGLDLGHSENRLLELKGKSDPIEVRVFQPSPESDPRLFPE
jgi:adenylate cyclase